MKTKKYIVLFAIALLAVIALTGSAQASVTVMGQVNSTTAEGYIPTMWLDVNPSDYATDHVRDGTTMEGERDYYYFDDITFMLDRNGYKSGDTDIPITVAMFCSGIERDIDGVVGDPYTNPCRSVTALHFNVSYADGTYTPYPVRMEMVECVVEETTYSKSLSEGWNLISLPLSASDNSTSAVLSAVLYDAVYKYNATSRQFESELDGTMNPGTGYFVNVTTAGTWTYSGTPYTSMSVDLKQGLNMVGWLNCSKPISDGLSSISGNYWYVASWNVATQAFEGYEPTAPEVFNDFSDMGRGTGYFISARADCPLLIESC